MQRSRRFNQPQSSAAAVATAPPLRAALWIWFACGLMALLAFPSLRGSSATIGWLPFWLVIAPLIDLVLLRRPWLAVASRAFLVRARRRRWPARQARRLQRRRVLRTSPRPQLVNP
jgi:hypothetical protein